jgi:hypothetical protein
MLLELLEPCSIKSAVVISKGEMKYSKLEGTRELFDKLQFEDLPVQTVTLV